MSEPTQEDIERAAVALRPFLHRGVVEMPSPELLRTMSWALYEERMRCEALTESARALRSAGRLPIVLDAEEQMARWQPVVAAAIRLAAVCSEPTALVVELQRAQDELCEAVEDAS